MRAAAARGKVPRRMARFTPVPFADRTEGQKVIIGAVIPALVGALAGFLVGASAVGYWVVAILAGVGAFLGGFEHDGGLGRRRPRLLRGRHLRHHPAAGA